MIASVKAIVHHRVRAPLSITSWCLLLAALLLVSIIAGVSFGAVHIAFGTTIAILWHQWLRIWGLQTDPDWTVQQFQIIWLIRMPRVLLAAVVGAGLAVVGAIMQAMVRNPLADPYLLGTSSGASVGAVCVLAYGSFAFAGQYAISAAAFVGALVATAAVYLLAQAGGRARAMQVILSGIAVSYMFAGVTSLITLTAGQRDLASSVLRWILGSLAGAQWSTLGVPAVVLMLGLAWTAGRSRALNALLLGEETAGTLGVETQRLRRALFVAVSLLTAVMVAASGAIGFVGLVIPHIARMMVGVDHRRVLPVCALGGATFLVLVDLLARILFAPTEIPVGVITSLIGGPFFIWLLARQPGSRTQ